MTNRIATLAVLLTLAFGTAHAGDLQWEPKDNKVVNAFNVAVDAFNAGNLDVAEARLRRAIKLQPDFGPAHLLMGQALYRLQRPADAIPWLERVAADPDHPEALSSLAWSLFATERFEDAREVGVRAVEAQPEDSFAWQALVMSELRLGSYDRIEERLTAARGAHENPDLACFSVQVYGELRRIDLAEDAMTVCRDSEDDGLLRNANAALERLGGDMSGAVDRSLALGDDSGAAYNRAAEAFAAKDYAGAERLCSRAIKLEHPTPSPILLRARARYEQKKYAAARKDLRSVLGDDGTWVQVTRGGGLTGVLTKSHELDLKKRMRGGAVVLVLLNADEERFDDAAQALKDARAAFGDTSGLIAAEAYLALGRAEAGRAWALMAKALRNDPEDWTFHLAGIFAYHDANTVTDDATAAVVAHGSPNTVFNLAAGASNAGQARRCLEVVEAFAAEDGTIDARAPGHAEQYAELLPGALKLGYGCAVESADIVAAEALGERAGWTNLRDGEVAKHADLLFTAKEYAAVVAHIERSGGIRGDYGDWLVDLLVRSHTELGQLDDALKHAKHERATAITRYNAGTALLVAERPADAQALLASACPELKKDAAEACRINLDVANERLARE